MTNSKETGHAINIANFEAIILEVASYGATYNPSKPNLKIPALNAQLTLAKNAMNALISAEPALKLAIDAREAAFKNLSPLVTRIHNALQATDVSQQVTESAFSLVRTIQGRRATPKLKEEQKKAAIDAGKEIVEISSSHMSFTNRTHNAEKLAKLLTSIPLYAPNEPELKLAAINTFITDLKVKNQAVINAEAPVHNARFQRNDILYKINTGIIDTTNDIKKYIKSVFGSTSPQYKELSKYKFSTPR